MLQPRHSESNLSMNLPLPGTSTCLISATFAKVLHVLTTRSEESNGGVAHHFGGEVKQMGPPWRTLRRVGGTVIASCVFISTDCRCCKGHRFGIPKANLAVDHWYARLSS